MIVTAASEDCWAWGTELVEAVSPDIRELYVVIKSGNGNGIRCLRVSAAGDLHLAERETMRYRKIGAKKIVTHAHTG